MQLQVSRTAASHDIHVCMWSTPGTLPGRPIMVVVQSSCHQHSNKHVTACFSLARVNT